MGFHHCPCEKLAAFDSKERSRRRSIKPRGHALELLSRRRQNGQIFCRPIQEASLRVAVILEVRPQLRTEFTDPTGNAFVEAVQLLVDLIAQRISALRRESADPSPDGSAREICEGRAHDPADHGPTRATREEADECSCGPQAGHQSCRTSPSKMSFVAEAPADPFHVPVGRTT